MLRARPVIVEEMVDIRVLPFLSASRLAMKSYTGQVMCRLEAGKGSCLEESGEVAYVDLAKHICFREAHVGK